MAALGRRLAAQAPILQPHSKCWGRTGPRSQGPKEEGGGGLGLGRGPFWYAPSRGDGPVPDMSGTD